MKTHKILLIAFLATSLIAHLVHFADAIGRIVQLIKNLLAYADAFSILSLLTDLINMVTILTGSIGLLLYFKNQKILNKWIMAFIIIENFRTITTISAMLRFPKEYFPSLSQVGFLYYGYLIIMIFTLIFSINYFSRLINIEKEYNGTGKISPTNSKLTRFINYIVDLLLIAGVSFDKFYVLKQTMEFKFIFILCLLVYYLFSETLYGRTLGKVCTNTILIRANNFLYKIFIRTFARLIPFEQFSFLSKKAQGWHDRLSNTYLYTLVP